MKRGGWAKCSGVDFKEQVKAFSEALSAICENKNPKVNTPISKREGVLRELQVSKFNIHTQRKKTVLQSISK